MKTVLVVAAHPDDEVLGCGGAIARHVSLGDHVYVRIVAEGITSRAQEGAALSLELGQLQDAARRAHQILGTKSIDFFSYPDNKLDSINLLDIVQRLEKEIEEISPQIIYTHHHGDLNIDHSIVYRAVVTACRPFPDSLIEKIFCFEVSSSTDWGMLGPTSMFVPNVFLNLLPYLPKKLEALGEYSTEMRDWPHSRSIRGVESLAQSRGAMCGLEAAEAFTLIRSIVRK
jgi:LmbE family N-acetylglucosaminyl deacetylase